jgi:Gpi18-like mannosyltransferase
MRLEKLIQSKPRAVIALLAVTLLARIPFFGSESHWYDSFGVSEWTWALVRHGSWNFYDQHFEVPADHLPGDLVILNVLGLAFRLFNTDFNFYDNSYVLGLKAVAAISDCAIALLLYYLGRQFLDPSRAFVASMLLALNPAAIYLSAVWGQWDSLSMVFVVGSLLALINRRIILATVFATIGCLIKPQLALVIPVMAVYQWRLLAPVARGNYRRIVTIVKADVFKSVSAAFLTFVVICTPFNVGFGRFGMKWSIFERISFAADRYDATTLGATNLWMLEVGRSQGPSDSTTVFGSVTYRDIGTLLVACCFFLACVSAFRFSNADLGLFWGSTVVMLGFFTFSTRAHERYLFPAMVLSIGIAMLAPRYLWLPIGLSITLFVSAWGALTWEWNGGGVSFGISRHLIVRVLSVTNLSLLLLLLTLGLREGSRPAGIRRSPSSRSLERLPT